MSVTIDNVGTGVRFDCPIPGCGYMVSGNFGQETDDAMDHIEEHWPAASAADRELLVADASELGFDPVGPSVTCFCGGEHITGSCLAGDVEVER